MWIGTARRTAGTALVALAAVAASSVAPASPRAEPSALSPRTSSSGATPDVDRVLSPLPKPRSLELPPPTMTAREALDALLTRLVSPDATVRDTAVREILEVEPDALPAIHERLGQLATSSDHGAMKGMLSAVRDKTRDELGRKAPSPDYLEMVEAHAKPDSGTFRDLVSVLAMGRMLRQLETTKAARELIGIYSHFGDFIRIDTQRKLAELGERSIAALIEAERHPAPKIARWAERQLDSMGKAVPGKAIQTKDPEVLADILRAYGRARNPDAARVVISFANSERTQIRDAAREAVVLMGEVANWQLRDTYENIVGKKPPREWSWDRTARELFSEFDRLRLSQVQLQFDQSLAKWHAGKLDDMADGYDRVLAESPTFERSDEMIPGYVDYAHSHLDDAPEKAIRALQRIVRLAEDGEASRSAESLLVTLRAEELLKRHIADQTLLKQALELDPKNARASRLLSRLRRGEASGEGRLRRYVGAGAIGVLALVAIAVIALRRRPSPPEGAGARDEPRTRLE